MEGWVKLHRKMLENPIVTKDGDHIAVWVYLLLNATHTEYDVVFKGERTTLQAGQLLTGRKSMSEKLKINETKIQRVLKCFESEHQIEQQTSNQNRLVTIVNWNEYQHSEQPNEQQVNNNRTTNEQQVNTNKNVKNINNDKNIYLYLYNIYRSKVKEAGFSQKIKIMSECKNTKEYGELSYEDKTRLYAELMAP